MAKFPNLARLDDILKRRGPASEQVGDQIGQVRCRQLSVSVDVTALHGSRAAGVEVVDEIEGVGVGGDAIAVDVAFEMLAPADSDDGSAAAGEIVEASIVSDELIDGIGDAGCEVRGHCGFIEPANPAAAEVGEE